MGFDGMGKTGDQDLHIWVTACCAGDGSGIDGCVFTAVDKVGMCEDG